MTAWAYECRSCEDDAIRWFVACESVAEMPADVGVLRIKVGDRWLCATVNRNRQIPVEGLLLREAVASDPTDCPECAEQRCRRPAEVSVTMATAAHDEQDAPDHNTRQVQAAAISLQGVRFVVVLVSLDMANSPGEADMLIDDLGPRFGNVPIVLMGQYEDGTPAYYGDRDLIDRLADVPIDRMPWKVYPFGE